LSGARNALFDPTVVGQAPQNQLAPQPTWADAASWHGQNLSDTWSAMQQPQTWTDAARQHGNAMLMGTTAPRTFYHFTNAPISEFTTTNSRGAVYLSPTEQGAVEGGLSGMRQRLTGADDFSAVGPMKRGDVPGGRVLSVTVPPDMRVYGEGLPASMTIGQTDAALERVAKLQHPDPAVLEKAKQLEMATFKRSSSVAPSDDKFIEAILTKYGDNADTAMNDAERARFNAIPQTLGAFRHLSDTDFENARTQDALRLLGYDAARVQDEGGLSLAVLNPSKLRPQPK